MRISPPLTALSTAKCANPLYLSPANSQSAIVCRLITNQRLAVSRLMYSARWKRWWDSGHLALELRKQSRRWRVSLPASGSCFVFSRTNDDCDQQTSLNWDEWGSKAAEMGALSFEETKILVFCNYVTSSINKSAPKQADKRSDTTKTPAPRGWKYYLYLPRTHFIIIVIPS